MLLNNRKMNIVNFNPNIVHIFRKICDLLFMFKYFLHRTDCQTTEKKD